MSRLDELPPDQRAVLALLVQQRRTYPEVAALLRIPERSVHDRAQAALLLLAPALARGLPPDQREEIGDYVLGQQQGLGEQLRTRTFLSSSPPARDWAQALAAELAPIAGTNLPEIPGASEPPAAPAAPVAQAAGPAAPPPVQDATPAPREDAGRQLPSSRVGGAVLLAVIVAGVVAAVLLLNKGSSPHHPSASSGTGRTNTASASNAVKATLAMRPPDPTSKAIGIVYVLSENGTHGIYIAAEHIPPTHHSYYAIWLYNSPHSFRGVSVTTVGSSGRIQGGSLLPSNAASYHEILLTHETSSRPSAPGSIVLSGDFNLG